LLEVQQAAEKVLLRGEVVPQRLLEPDSLQSIYVRPEGRTLQKHEFFRSLVEFAQDGSNLPKALRAKRTADLSTTPCST
jgi:hypothetical protein